MGFASETESTGTLGITLSSQEYLKNYQETNPNDGDGVFVYVQNIDTGEMFRFPLSESNSYSGRFDIPYGNYRVIKNPDATSTQYTVACDTVFTIGKNNPDVSISCFIEEPQYNNTKDGQSGIHATPSTAQTSATPVPEDTNKEFSLPLSTIFTIFCFVIMAGLWVYRHFFKHRN